jgi:hypothetical protein
MKDLKEKCIDGNNTETIKTSPLQSQHVFPLLLFAANNKNKLKINSDVYDINTTQILNFHQTLTNLSLHQKGIYSSGIKVFNPLSANVENMVSS